MRVMRTDTPEREMASVVALLTGLPEVDRTTIAALRLVEPHFLGSDDPAEVLAAVTPATRLMICDGDNPGFDLTAISDCLASHPGATLLVLLGEGEDPRSRFGPEIDHFLCRPFREETLAAQPC